MQIKIFFRADIDCTDKYEVNRIQAQGYDYSIPNDWKIVFVRPACRLRAQQNPFTFEEETVNAQGLEFVCVKEE